MRSISKALKVVGVLSFVLLPALHAQEKLGPPKPTPSEVAKKFVGTWKGTMTSPVRDDAFPVTLQLHEFANGKWCGVLDHPLPLDADGKLLGIKIDGKSMYVAQTIFRGRERCLDGLNVLTLIDDNTIERVWIDPDTGMARDKGILKRQAK